MNGVYYALGLVILAVAGVGLVLAWPKVKEHETDLPEYKDARAGLGAALLTGAVISGAFFVLQVLNQAHQTSLANSQTLRLTLTIQKDLSHADLSDQDLNGFDFTGKLLFETNFSNALLTNADFVSARLGGATFDGARLDGADLTGAVAERASFDGATLSGATLISAVLDRATFGVTSHGRRADLSGAKLIGASLTGACLARADLRNAALGGANLANADLNGADLRGTRLERDGVPANLRGASVAGARFDRSNARFFRIAPVRPAEVASVRAPVHATPDRVTAVSDGDTLYLARLGWTEIIGLNAPNFNEPFGLEARAFLQQVLTKDPNIRYDLGRNPREGRPGGTGRSLAYVWLNDGRFLNSLLLEKGYAVRGSTYPQAEGSRYAALFKAAEQEAKDAGLGVWSTCPKLK